VVINKAIIVNNNNLDKLSTFVNMGAITPAVNHAAAIMLEKSDNLFFCADRNFIYILL